jgi:hypothetical protein
MITNKQTNQSEEAKYKMLKWVENKVQHRLRGKSNKNLRILRESLDRITQITDIPYQENLEGKTYRKGKSTYTRDTRSEAYDSLTDILTTFVSRASLPSPPISELVKAAFLLRSDEVYMRILLRVLKSKSFQALQSYLKKVGEYQLAVTNILRAAQNVKTSNHVIPAPLSLQLLQPPTRLPFRPPQIQELCMDLLCAEE